MKDSSEVVSSHRDHDLDLPAEHLMLSQHQDVLRGKLCDLPKRSQSARSSNASYLTLTTVA